MQYQAVALMASDLHRLELLWCACFVWIQMMDYGKYSAQYDRSTCQLFYLTSYANPLAAMWTPDEEQNIVGEHCSIVLKGILGGLNTSLLETCVQSGSVWK